MNTETTLQRWARHAEWPLAVAALLLIYTASLAVFDKERYLHGATIDELRSEIRALAQEIHARG